MDNIFIVVNSTTVQVHRKTIVSDDVVAIFEFSNYVIACGIISVVGICTNTSNLVTFVRLGFKDTINVSLTALAIADLGHLLCLFFLALAYSKVFCGPFCHVDFRELAYLFGGVPRGYFVCLAGFITSKVALERCLCVLMPLKVKTILTLEKSVCALVAVLIVGTAIYFPLFYTARVGWVFNSKTNRTWISLVYLQSTFEINAMAFKAIVVLLVLTYVIVTLCTGTIVYKLSSQSSWRAGTAGKNAGPISDNHGDNSGQEQSSNKKGLVGKDRRATRTVVLIATMYIICFFPGTVIMLAMSILPEFNKGAPYKNLLEACWSTACVFEGFCSSANIIIYFNTSSRYKEAFLSLFKSGVERPLRERWR